MTDTGPMTHPNSEVPELAAWRLVPIEPDDTQVSAGLESLAESTGEPILHIVRDALFAYRAMVRTAPTPPLPASAVGEMDPSTAFSDWINQGPKLAKAAGVYVGITVYDKEPSL